jgi:glutathione S-transferase
MTTALPVLYSFRRCPYAMRARLALAVAGLPYELREVVLRDKPPEMMAASPKGTVPVLVLPGGEVIDQSLEIMLWALHQNDPAGWLTPQRASLADMLAVIAANDGPFKRHLDRYKYPNRYPNESGNDPAGFAQSHRNAAAQWLMEIEAMLVHHTPAEKAWLFGQSASLADMATLPFVRQFAHTDPAWFTAQPWPYLQSWLGQFETSDLYQRVMEKQAPWRFTAGALLNEPPVR